MKSGVENVAVGNEEVKLIFSEEQENQLVLFITVFFGLLPTEARKFAYECGQNSRYLIINYLGNYKQ